jgi:hypothetical protein
MDVKKFCNEDGCCLHDTATHEFQCIADTFMGPRCSNPPHKNTPYCKLHNKRCFQVYRGYKTICEHFSNWKLKDLKSFTTEQLQSDIKAAEECKRMRLDHFIECYKTREDEEMDVAHGKAISYMDDVVRMAKAEVYRRRFLKFQ